jgi:excinuclease ABC subunit A
MQDEELMFSKNFSCPEHGIGIPPLEPKLFSFNNPLGACKKCAGLGSLVKFDPDLLIPNKEFSIAEGAIKCAGWAMGENKSANKYFLGLSEKYKFSLDEKIKDIPRKTLEIILYGPDNNGIIPSLEQRFNNAKSDWLKSEIETLFTKPVTCDSCRGKRLSPQVLAVTAGGINISQFCDKNIKDLYEFISNLKFTGKNKIISEPILKEIKSRLKFLKNVGLDYLSLSRCSGTLSGGEAQRIRLATQIGSALTGVLYVLDEPSIGLHQCDNEKLIKTLKHLRDIGNTVIVVEHDEETIKAADFIVDVGPEAGEKGGRIVAEGSAEEISLAQGSITGEYLSGRKKILIPKQRRTGNGKFLKIKGAKKNNLKNINVKIPLGTFTCVTGVSGSGKSTLVNDIIFAELSSKVNHSKKAGKEKTGAEIDGTENIERVINIDQDPIGRTPRSNPATYTGVFTDIRELFATTPSARSMGFGTGRFSFNAKSGRCEACRGDGIIKIEMHFLSDLYIPCEVCGGKRYNRETLEVKFRDKNIYDILNMTIDDAFVFFENIPRISSKIKTLIEVGLGYVKLGQPATTLSGGEAQRVKLASELSRRTDGKAFYILDEPTTGLHAADVQKLINILQKFTDGGNTVLVIEHNLDLIKTADYIIDLGPGGGDAGGTVTATGTPEEICKNKNSVTGKYLKNILQVDKS